MVYYAMHGDTLTLWQSWLMSPKKYTVFMPLVMHLHTPPRPLKAGLAASSHDDLAERVRLLGGVAGVRGWKIYGNEIPVTAGGAEYVPCFWCDLSAEVRGGVPTVLSQLHVPELVASGDKPLLFLNEPDMAHYGHIGQCEITPHRAAVLYLDIRARFPNFKLVGCGVSHLDYTHGFQWLGMFIEQVVRLSGRTPEFWAWDTHNYIFDQPPLAIIDALQGFLLSRGIVSERFYVSEWAGSTPEQVRAWRRAYDNDPRIAFHAYYCQYKATWDGDGRFTSLFVEGSNPLQLSPLGVAWVEAGRT